MLRSSPTTSITQKILVAGARNRESGKAIVAFLLANSSNLCLTEDLLKAAAKNHRCGKQVLALLFDRFSRSTAINITEVVLQVAVTAESWGYDVQDRTRDGLLIRSTLEMLVTHPTSKITTGLIQFAAGNETCGRQLVEDLITHPKNTIEIDESIMEAAASNNNFGDSIVQLLLTQPGKVPLTERLISTASLNTGCGKEILRVLLEAKAEDGHQFVSKLIEYIGEDAHGLRDALFHAAYRGKLAAMRVLVSHGADIHEEAECIGNALHVAAFRGQLDAVELLVQLGAIVDAPGGPHSSALLAACHRSNITVAQCLINAGAEIESPDLMGKTALHRCLQNHDTIAADSLLTLGASISL